MKKCFVIATLLMSVLVGAAQEKRAMTAKDLWAMKRIGNVILSPDGKWLVYEVSEYDIEKNSGNTDLWLLDTQGGEPRRLTTYEGYDGTPRWKPDGRSVTFLSDRNGSSQIYSLSLAGGEAYAITDFPVDVDNFIWSPDGRKIAFSAQVFTDVKSLQETADRNKTRADSKVKATQTDRLLYRHWNRWTEGKKSHIFLCTEDGKEVQDLTPGDYDAPPLSLGGNQDFVFSPDGQDFVFVSNHDPMVSISTNNDLFLIPTNGGETRCLTATNKAVDNQPLFSPNGQYLLYKAMKRPGFEADQFDLVLLDRKSGTTRVLTEAFDLDPGTVLWSPDSKKIYFDADEQGRTPIYMLDLAKNDIKKLVAEHSNSLVDISPDGKTLYFKRQAVDRPFELFKVDASGKMTQKLTTLNDKLLSQLNLNPVEDFWFNSFDGKRAHGILVKPPAFDPNKKYPLVYLIHGGPQGMFGDDFHYRWNASMFAAPGYVVAMVNFRGSKGYGQAWCDAVSKDWGGGPFQDLMAGLDHLTSNFNYIDGKKIAAAGASYGGFMINWIATQTDRFKALVSHAGVFDQVSMYGATEELWFPEWEFGGTPYENPELYHKWSPSKYIENFKKFKIPTLVVHGQRDYRVPVTQGFQMFTALQRMGVPSRLLYFPDETHFVSKPQNALLWWDEVLGWIEKWIQS